MPAVFEDTAFWAAMIIAVPALIYMGRREYKKINDPIVMPAGEWELEIDKKIMNSARRLRTILYAVLLLIGVPTFLFLLRETFQDSTISDIFDLSEDTGWKLFQLLGLFSPLVVVAFFTLGRFVFPMLLGANREQAASDQPVAARFTSEGVFLPAREFARERNIFIPWSSIESVGYDGVTSERSFANETVVKGPRLPIRHALPEGGS